MTNQILLIACVIFSVAAVAIALGTLTTVKNSALKTEMFGRKIIRREKTEDGEIVELECGHAYHLVRHQLSKIPCPECAREDGPVEP